MRGLRNRCGRPQDILFDGLRPLEEFLDRVRVRSEAGKLRLERGGERTASPAARRPLAKAGNGQYGDGVTREAVMASWEELKAAIEEFGASAEADLAAQLRDELWEVVELYQRAKQRAGQARFHGPAAVCARPAAARRARAASCSNSTSASSSTSSRTRTRCRRRFCCCSRRTIRRSVTGIRSARSGQAVRGRRSEAVDLPVPPCRRAAIPARLPRLTARGVSAES